jgi:hypothetical protein
MLNLTCVIGPKSHLPKEGPLTMGFIEEPAAPLQPLPPLVGVIDFDIGVLGLSSNFFVDGVLALDEVPLRGLKKKRKIKKII